MDSARRGMVARAKSLKWPSYLFLVLLVVDCAVVAGIVIYTLVEGDGKRCEIRGQASECPTKYIVNKAVTALAMLVFQLWFGFSGVLSGNQWEFLSSVLIGFLLIVFAAVRLFGNLKNILVTDIIMFVTVVLVQFGCLVVLPWLLKEHKWRLYRRVGADLQLRRMYSRYLVLICLLKILLLLSIINGTSSGLNRRDQPGTLALDVLHLISALAFALLSYLAFRFEWRVLVFIALFLALYSPAYILYWFYEVVATKQVYSSDYALKALAISFLATGSLTLIAQPAAMILLAYQYTKFDSGFKQIFDDPYTPIPTAQHDPGQAFSPEPVSLFGAPAPEDDDDMSDLDYSASRNSLGFTRDGSGSGSGYGYGYGYLHGAPQPDEESDYLYQ